MVEEFMNLFVDTNLKPAAKRYMADIIQKAFWSGWNNAGNTKHVAEKELLHILCEEGILTKEEMIARFR